MDSSRWFVISCACEYQGSQAAAASPIACHANAQSANTQARTAACKLGGTVRFRLLFLEVPPPAIFDGIRQAPGSQNTGKRTQILTKPGRYVYVRTEPSCQSWRSSLKRGLELQLCTNMDKDGPILVTNTHPYAQIYTDMSISNFNIDVFEIFKYAYEHVPCVESDHTAI